MGLAQEGVPNENHSWERCIEGGIGGSQTFCYTDVLF